MFKIRRQTFVNGFLVKERVVKTMAEYDRYMTEVIRKYGDEARTEDFDMLKERDYWGKPSYFCL